MNSQIQTHKLIIITLIICFTLFILLHGIIGIWEKVENEKLDLENNKFNLEINLQISKLIHDNCNSQSGSYDRATNTLNCK